MPATIVPATPADLPAIVALLAACSLPPDGLADHLATTLVARDGDQLIGSAALEVYGDLALLRSVAVSTPWRGQRLGEQLIQTALRLAQSRDIQAVYLLTTTADDYVPRFGFRPITRAAVPISVQASVEFHGACPESAIAMALERAGELPSLPARRTAVQAYV